MAHPTAPHGLDEPLADQREGRSFSASRRVRWGDADAAGRLRLDGAARFLQDVANDDSRDAGTGGGWVVRRTRIDVTAPIRVDEVVELTTFAGGLGGRWAERRTRVVGDRGGRLEATSLWVHLSGDGRPARLADDFLATYAAAADGRRVGSRLLHPAPPPDDPDAAATTRPWPLRSTDLDGLGHVNNAATWAPVEDELDRRGLVPSRAEVEHRAAIEPGDDVALTSVTSGDTGADGVLLQLWLTVEGQVRASAAVRARPRA